MGLVALALGGAGTALWKSSRVGENAPVELRSRDSVENQLESAISAEKPDDVSAIIYDKSAGRVYANMAARDFAAAEASRFYNRFNEPGIVDEIAGLLKDSELYKSHPEQTRIGVSRRLQSQFGKERLAVLIQDHLYRSLLEQIKKENAVAIKNPLGKYNIYAFPPIPAEPNYAKEIIMDAYTKR